MKTLWLVVGIALVLLVVYLLTAGRREKFETGDAGSPGLPTTAPAEAIPSAGGVGDRQPIQCASGETTAFTAPHPTAPQAQICIPAGTDIFDMPADGMEAARELQGGDPAIIAKAACKRDGYSLFTVYPADFDPTMPMPLPKCVANTPTGDPNFGDTVTEPEGSAPAPFTPPAGYGEVADFGTPPPAAPTCPSGQIKVFGKEMNMQGPNCIPSGTDSYAPDTDRVVPNGGRLCRPGYFAASPMTAGAGPAPDRCYAIESNGGGSGSPFTSGNTTGGSSSTSAGPNSGGGGNRRKQIFGPLFTEIGDGGNFSKGEDSSKTNQYPELLGGGEVRKSTLVPGVGVVDPSKNSDTSGLPTPGGLGANEDSKFLPTSRVPGDMEKIPDPWRVSQSFSASNYSFKTDPVPFLTNFSAFQK